MDAQRATPSGVQPHSHAWVQITELEAERVQAQAAAQESVQAQETAMAALEASEEHIASLQQKAAAAQAETAQACHSLHHHTHRFPARP